MAQPKGTITAGAEKEVWGLNFVSSTSLTNHTPLFRTENTVFQWELKDAPKPGAKKQQWRGKLEAVTTREAAKTEEGLETSALEMDELFKLLKDEKLKPRDSRSKLDGIVRSLKTKSVKNNFIRVLESRDLSTIRLAYLRNQRVRINPQLTVTLELRHIHQFFEKASEARLVNERNVKSWKKRRQVMADAAAIASSVLKNTPPQKSNEKLRNADKIRGYLTLVAQVALVSRRVEDPGEDKEDYYKSLDGGKFSSNHSLNKDAYGFLHKTPLADLWRFGLSQNDRAYLSNNRHKIRNEILDTAWAGYSNEGDECQFKRKISGDSDDMGNEKVPTAFSYVNDVLGWIEEEEEAEKPSIDKGGALAKRHYKGAVDGDARRIHQIDSYLKRDAQHQRLRVALELRDLGNGKGKMADAKLLMSDYTKVKSVIEGIHRNYKTKHRKVDWRTGLAVK